MSKHICIFEDDSFSDLLPLVYFRPTFNLRCGILTLKEKVHHAFPKAIVSLHCRSYLVEYMRQRNPSQLVNAIDAEEMLFINGRVIVDEQFITAIDMKRKQDVVYVMDDFVVAARLSGPRLNMLKSQLGETISLSNFDGIPVEQVEVKMIGYSWDLIRRNGDQIRNDYALLKKMRSSKKPKIRKYPGVQILNKKNVFVGDGTVIKPGVVIDAENGPVYIGKNVQVMPFSCIIGPAYIGDHSIVKVGAKIYQDCSIGPMCKVGGELEASIIHSYANKQHDGFLGHSYLGAWVNCGAGTTTSDLKNNYSTVKVTVNGKQVDSGSQFVGVTIGDHSKTAINSTFNSGTVIGVSSNIFGAGFPPKFVPSFSWGAAGETFTTYDFQKAIAVAKTVMKRRNITITGAEENLFRVVHDLTLTERKDMGLPS
ncbi:MAG: GlmU family protein [Bacteroidota bacterium]